MNRDRIRELARIAIERMTLQPASDADIAIVSGCILSAVREALLEEPSDEAWSGLARDIMMWLDMNNGRPTGQSLYQHLKRVGTDAPEWLYKIIPDMPHVPSKGNRVVAIYRAMAAQKAKELG